MFLFSFSIDLPHFDASADLSKVFCFHSDLPKFSKLTIKTPTYNCNTERVFPHET